ncbi:unnamed protein product [Schistosoma curassoni]|uniref:NADH-quinone oxidoreductase subunit B n=1 Tax=Schistosoma curassoni TaxID=6186 RepID=A0A183L4I1_9TREM|nr:unnamed protein product [Schistosoma curassoni]
MNNGGRPIPIVFEDTIDYLRDRGMWYFDFLNNESKICIS